MTSETIHTPRGNRLYITVWGGLLVLTVTEVILAYQHLPVAGMLLLLLSLSIVKAGLIMAYFMHLRFERLSLTLTLVPTLMACIGLLLIFFPDSVRLAELGR